MIYKQQIEPANQHSMGHMGVNRLAHSKWPCYMARMRAQLCVIVCVSFYQLIRRASIWIVLDALEGVGELLTFLLKRVSLVWRRIETIKAFLKPSTSWGKHSGSRSFIVCFLLFQIKPENLHWSLVEIAHRFQKEFFAGHSATFKLAVTWSSRYLNLRALAGSDGFQSLVDSRRKGMLRHSEISHTPFE